MKKFFTSIILLASIFFFPHGAIAHFGLVIPSNSTITSQKAANVHLEVAFSHPFSRKGMDMGKPAHFFVVNDGKKTDLSLEPAKFMEHNAWAGEYRIQRPGVYQFVVVPQPYFEPAENCFIIHYAKTCVAAFGAEEGWSDPVDLPMEIVPLTRPFGNYAGNVFQGTVLLKGKPLPGAVVEVECLNRNGRHIAPNEYFETQAVLTDKNGNFTFAVPWAGWWGFAALATSPDKLPFNGEEKDVELGGVIWVEFTQPQLRK